MQTKIPYMLLGAALAVSGTILAATIIPFQFTAGQTARAEDVNANFNAVATGINGVDSRVTALEQASAPATGLKVIRVVANQVGSNFLSARAVCPANSTVIGGGCADYARSIQGYAFNSSSRLIESYPDTATSWTCTMGINANSTGNALAQAYALCMQATPTSVLTVADSQ